MRYLLIGLVSVGMLFSCFPCFAEEGPRVRQTDPATNLVAMAEVNPHSTGWYGPYYVSWFEYTLEDVYVEFTNGAWAVMNAGYYDIGSIAAIATACKNHNRAVFMKLIDNVPWGFQVQ